MLAIVYAVIFSRPACNQIGVMGTVPAGINRRPGGNRAGFFLAFLISATACA